MDKPSLIQGNKSEGLSNPSPTRYPKEEEEQSLSTFIIYSQPDTLIRRANLEVYGENFQTLFL